MQVGFFFNVSICGQILQLKFCLTVGIILFCSPEPPRRCSLQPWTSNHTYASFSLRRGNVCHMDAANRLQVCHVNPPPWRGWGVQGWWTEGMKLKHASNGKRKASSLYSSSFSLRFYLVVQTRRRLLLFLYFFFWTNWVLLKLLSQQTETSFVWHVFSPVDWDSCDISVQNHTAYWSSAFAHVKTSVRPFTRNVRFRWMHISVSTNFRKWKEK